MNRADLQALADTRVADARVLLDAERWPAAYYLLGYAVECALKACTSRQFGQHEVPDKKIVNNFYTHRLDDLLSISGAKAALEAKAKAEPQFRTNWNIVRDWNETSRYDPLTTETKARDMYTSVTDPKFGVLPWLKTVW
jgi:HEPN domain-containing protein